MKRSYVSIFSCIAALAVIPALSYADDTSRNQEIAQRFAKCDINHDGKLTQVEAKSCMPRIYDHFNYLDSGNKGYLTVAEIQAAVDR